MSSIQLFYINPIYYIVFFFFILLLLERKKEEEEEDGWKTMNEKVYCIVVNENEIKSEWKWRKRNKTNGKRRGSICQFTTKHQTSSLNFSILSVPFNFYYQTTAISWVMDNCFLICITRPNTPKWNKIKWEKKKTRFILRVRIFISYYVIYANAFVTLFLILCSFSFSSLINKTAN